VRLNCNYTKQEKKTNKSKTPPDIILKVVRAMKIHNLSIRQAELEFNTNYRILNRYCKKIPEYVITNPGMCDNQPEVWD